MTEALSRLTTALADRYRLDRELGQGGMATVYLAHDLKHDRKVAIKVLRPELAAVIGAERFLREIKTIANLSHPHILGLIDSGEVNGTAYYVMPFVEGESLRDRLTRQKQLAITETVRLATEIAGALDYAHRHGVIHRDIKPENILLHDGRALVADFGIALAVSSAGGGSRMTETGMSLGTPHYMSPEQAMGERDISARSDIYALGCVTYEMLTGDPPFTGSTAQSIVAKVMTEKPTPPSRLRDTVTPEIEDAVLCALSKLPADRQSTAAEFATALGGQADGRSGGRTLRQSSARPPVRLLAPFAVATTVLAALALWGWLRPAPEAPTSRQRIVLWQHAVGSMMSPGVSRIGTQAAIAPDGSSIVFADPVNDSALLRIKLRSEADSRPIPGTEGGYSPFFSPDGRWIGFLTRSGLLRKMPVEGGAPITLATDANRIYAAGAWREDGTIIYVGNEVRTVSSTGGPSSVLGRPRPQKGNIVNSGLLSLLPGDRGLLFTTCPGNCAVGSNVEVFDFAADSNRPLIKDALQAWYLPTGHILYADRTGAIFAAEFDLKHLTLASSPIPVLDNVLPGSFAVSKSGAVLYAIAAGGAAPAELVWVSRQGTVQPVDTTWRANFQYPALAPDGKTVAVSIQDASTQLWVRRADGTRQRLTDSGTVNWRPTWSPDGRSIAFLSNRNGGEQMDYDAYELMVDGSAAPRLLLDYKFGVWEAQISADRQWLVFRSDEEANIGRIRARRMTGDTTLVPLVVGSFLANNVGLSPDGQWLAYVSDRSGSREVYVTPFPSATTSHLVSAHGGSEVRWGSSGRELFYKGDGEHQLMAVSIAPGSSFLAGTPRPLFPLTDYREARNRPQYDVAPDGQHFLMIRELVAKDPTVVYAEHWFTEMQAKVKAKR